MPAGRVAVLNAEIVIGKVDIEERQDQLFLDELPEFKRSVLEVLRQPVEDRKVTISRAKFTVEYPASFMLLASMNPCSCVAFLLCLQENWNQALQLEGIAA